MKLAQLAYLFAEVDHIARTSGYDGGSKKEEYIPLIITGDFNSTPRSAVYDFVTKGSVKYASFTLFFYKNTSFKIG